MNEKEIKEALQDVNAIPVDEELEDDSAVINMDESDIVEDGGDEDNSIDNPTTVAQQPQLSPEDIEKIKQIIAHCDRTVIDYLNLIYNYLDLNSIIVPTYQIANRYVCSTLPSETPYSEVAKLSSVYAQKMLSQLDLAEVAKNNE